MAIPPNKKHRFLAWTIAVFRSALSFLFSAVLWCVLLGAAGEALILYGIYLLAGVAWTCIAVGVPFIVLSVIIFRGMRGD